MRTVIQAARLRIDPDGVLADDNRAHERRWFECEQTYGGVFILRGELDAEGGALVKTAIDALSHGMTRGETRTGSQNLVSWCAARTIAACTRRGGAFTSLMALPWSSRHPDEAAPRSHLLLPACDGSA